MQDLALLRPWKFVGPDGTRYWSGLLQTGFEREVLNVGGTLISAGEAVWGEATSLTLASRIPRWDLPATSDPVTPRLSGNRVSAVDNVGFLGVALEAIPISKTGRVGGRGTICCVKSLAAGALTSNVPGAYVFGSGTAGSVDCASAAAPLPGLVLGMVLLPAGTAANTTGSDTQLGIEVNPH